MNIHVCVGSSCHLKGSKKIIQLMEECLKTNKLTDSVQLSAAFCLGKCTDGVTIKVDNQIVCGVSEHNFKDIFQAYVLEGELS